MYLPRFVVIRGVHLYATTLVTTQPAVHHSGIDPLAHYLFYMAYETDECLWTSSTVFNLRRLFESPLLPGLLAVN